MYSRSEHRHTHIFVDDWDGPIRQQLSECVPGVEVLALVCEVVQSEQDLGAGLHSTQA